MCAGELPTHWGHPTSTTSAEPPDPLLYAILAPLVMDPPPMPGWTLPAWRKAMQRPESAPVLLQSSLAGGRLQPLLAWVSSKTRPSLHLGAAAAALAVLDTAVHRGQPDVTALARELHSAVLAVRPLATRLHSQARTLPSPYLDRRPDPAGRTDQSAQRADSPFLSPASLLLRQAGYELRADAALADRLAASLGRGIGPLDERCPTRKRPASVLRREFPALHQTTGSTARARPRPHVPVVRAPAGARPAFAGCAPTWPGLLGRARLVDRALRRATAARATGRRGPLAP